MTEEDIRKAACEAWDAVCVDQSRFKAQVISVYRAGMAAERAQCIAEAQGELYETPNGIRTVAYLRAYNDGVWSVIERLKEKK